MAKSPPKESSNVAWLQRRIDNLPQNVAPLFPIIVERAENAEIWDVEHKRYIDFVGGVGVLNVGHRHPRVLAAIQEQLQHVMHTAFQISGYSRYIELAERLNEIAPITEKTKTAFYTVGVEAVENAVKIARIVTKRRGIISFTGSFHGRTLLGLTLTGKTLPYKAGIGAPAADVYHAPFPVALHNVTPQSSINAIRQMFQAQIAAKDIAAVILEAVQGEGGFYIAPFEWLQELRQICSEHGILLIADEIQSGMGRTGKFFALEHSQVEADLICCAKSLAGGLPLAAVIGRASIMDSVPPGALGTTYGGNPVSCAAALAVLDVIEKEKLLSTATELGKYAKNRLSKLLNKYNQIGEIRILGGMIALEFWEKGEPVGKPLAKIAQQLSQQALKNGLLLLPCGIYGNVIRILVPLTVSKKILEEGFDILEQSLAQVINGK